jgi:acetylornithine deacetylase
VSSAYPRTTVGWLARLVAHDTSAGESNLELIRDVQKYLDAIGARTDVIPGPRAGTANLYATIGPPVGSAVILSAHTDVVTADRDQWTSAPFTLDSRGDRLYGRGVADMKGFIAVVLASLPNMVATGLRRPLAVALSADEELGVQGVWPMLDAIAALPDRPAFCIVGEPTRMEVAVAHKGKVSLRLTVRGVAAHAGIGGRGLSAIRGAAEVIRRLYELEAEFASACVDSRFEVPHATVNVGRVDGGVAINTVADRCSLDVEIRTLPGQNPDCVVSDIEEAARRAAKPAALTLEVLAGYPGLEQDGEVPGLVAQMAGAIHYGLAMNYGAEGGAFRSVVGVPVVLCGPGDVAQAHTVDEFIDKEQLVRCERFVRRLGAWLS